MNDELFNSTSTLTIPDDTTVVGILERIEYNISLTNNFIYWVIIITGTVLMLYLLYRIIKIFI